MIQTQNLNIDQVTELIPPCDLKAEIPASEKSIQVVAQSREEIKAIINGTDQRQFLIVGPCSIHDEKAALDYATRLQKVIKQYRSKLYIIMRVYFEKPRTTIAWKGLINDPHLNNTFDLPTGLRKARQLLSRVSEMGIPTATELLDPIVPQYISDLVSWAAIGARTTESQTHREMASGLSMPVGYKNSTDGKLQVAMDAMQSALHAHHFIGINQEGHTSVIKTKGNPWGHVILRGGHDRPNYDPASIAEAVEKLTGSKLNQRVMVDCSHANSNKKHENQEVVWKSVIEQVVAGNRNILGMMLESHINEGNQKIPADLSQLKYGVSITDACVNWETTERLLQFAYEKL
jgi:3-deoxy-7-phosphoheptulonate synthase